MKRCAPLIALLAALAGSIGCRDETSAQTEVIVLVSAERRVRERVQNIEIAVEPYSGGANGSARAPVFEHEAQAPFDWPLKLVLVPKQGDPERRYRLTVHARDGGQLLVTARLVSGFVAGQRRYAQLVLEDACRGVDTCLPIETCHAGACVEALVDAEQLGLSADRAADVGELAARAAAERDAGARDGGADADSGIDARVPAAGGGGSTSAGSGAATGMDASSAGASGSGTTVQDAGKDSGPPDSGTDSGPPDAGDAGDAAPDTGTDATPPEPTCTPACGAHATCVVTGSTAACTCDGGYASAGGGPCTNVDECALGLDDCYDHPDSCTDSDGSFSCGCPLGLSGNGRGPTGCARPSCGINSGFAGDDACLVAPAAADGFQIHIGPSSYGDQDQITAHKLDPGQEAAQCVSFHTPNGAAISYAQIEVSARPGAFKMLATVYATEHTDRGWGVCRDSGTGTNPDVLSSFLALTGHEQPLRAIAPENSGVSAQLPANAPVQLDLHAFNFGDERLLREVWINVYYAKTAQTAQPRFVRALGGLGWSVFPIAPGTDQTYPFSCPIASAGRLLWLTSAMHSRVVRQSAWIKRAGTGTRVPIFQRSDYSDQAAFHYDSLTTNPALPNASAGAYSGMLELSAGDTLEWECRIVNDGMNALRYAHSLNDGAMCNLFGETVGPTIACVIQ